MNKKALIAMSGGVDSSVAAYMMKEAGYDCLGVTMRLFNNEDAGIPREKSCCSLEDVEDARSVAFSLDIPFYVFNFTDDFKKQVIGRFISAYEQGRTPNPCIDCNRYLKFQRLYTRARELDYDYIVTGHYARIESSGGRYILKKAADPSKDQSYVLYSMTQEQLSRTIFPLGDFNKAQIRDLAATLGFINAKKRDSQDICFVPDGDYARIIQSHTGKSYPPGDIVDTRGNILGRHSGIIHYTVGQRKGLGLALERPVYVAAIDPEANTVTVGENESLYSRELRACDLNWIAWEKPPGEFRAAAKIRYRQQEQPAAIIPDGDGSVRIIFDEPQRAVTRGQAVVLYDGDTVLGGGTIC